jgi:hypothetical protein
MVPCRLQLSQYPPDTYAQAPVHTAAGILEESGIMGSSGDATGSSKGIATPVEDHAAELAHMAQHMKAMGNTAFTEGGFPAITATPAAGVRATTFKMHLGASGPCAHGQYAQ